MKKCSIVIMVFSLFFLTSNGQIQPVKVIFDSDMALDSEDMNALCLLHALADRGEAEILATIASGYETNRASGATMDAINTFYGRPDIPVGTTKINLIFHKYAIPIAPSSWTTIVRDNWPHDVPDDNKCPSAVSVYREVLSKQPDNSVVIVTTGWLVNLQDLLESKPDNNSNLTGKELVSLKVKELSVMGGIFPGGDYPKGWEYNFAFAGTGRCSRYVMENWPGNVPVTISGFEIGVKIISGKVYDTQLPASPLRTGLEKAWNALKTGRQSWDETSVLYGVRGSSYNGEVYWKKQEEGSVYVNDTTGSTKWLITPDKNQSYLIEYMPPDSIARLMERLIIKSTNDAIKNK
ncbi:MAG: nucleoside hydrolase [Bacteroidales bacterium]|nr:nucleoside hydrolase [Bacteroidales bacterium]